jgi:thiol-disulfide isomerase/thioredoxin
MALFFGLLPLRAFALDSGPLFGARFTDVNGKAVTMDGLRGKPLLVNFWARWCPPCKKEFPDLVAAQAKHKARGLVVLGIAIEDAAGADKVKEFAQAYGLDYSILLAGDQGLALMRALGNETAGLPFSLAINRAGQVVASKLGVMSKPEMEAAIEKAL